MHDASSSILPPWLLCLLVFALSSIALTVILVGAAHSVFGEMRPMNGFLVLGVGSFGILVALVVAVRYALRAVRRNPN